MHWFALIIYNLIITIIVYNMIIITLMDGLLSIIHGHYHLLTRIRRFSVNLVICILIGLGDAKVFYFVHIQNYGEYIAQRYLLMIGILLASVLVKYTFPIWRYWADRILPIQLANIHTYDDEYNEFK